MTNILWVEDQLHWINKFAHTLETSDFEGKSTDSAEDGSCINKVLIFKFAEAACQHIKQTRTVPDIAILDANMNGNDEAGFTVSRALNKKWPTLPIIYLSEHSGTKIEQQAFEQARTQDFIAKHQENIESILCWRIRAVLRQQTIKNASTAYCPDDLITSGALSIDLSSWDVYWHGERLMNPSNSKRPLPPAPRKILRCLVESSPRPLTTLQIGQLLEIDNFNYASYRQHIKTLRHSFEQASRHLNKPSFIEACKSGQGITTFGDDGAYCWKPIEASNQ